MTTPPDRTPYRVAGAGSRAELAERLREMVRTDHLRGCEGREYECSCGHIDRQDALLLEAADALATPSDKGEGQ